VLVLATPASIFADVAIFVDEFEDDSINPDHWVIDGERRGYAGAPAGDWTWSHHETVYDEGDPDGYLRMCVSGPYTPNTYGAEAWIRTTHDYNDGGWYTANFKWKAVPLDTHYNHYFIQITDGYIPPAAPFHWQYVEPRPPELAPTVDLLRSYNADLEELRRGGRPGEPPYIPQGSPATWSIVMDPSGTARLYNGPDGTGDLLREEALDPSSGTRQHNNACWVPLLACPAVASRTLPHGLRLSECRTPQEPPPAPQPLPEAARSV